jgi:hypothetical protein
MPAAAAHPLFRSNSMFALLARSVATLFPASHPSLRFPLFPFQSSELCTGCADQIAAVQELLTARVWIHIMLFIAFESHTNGQ